jgi:hypothetical protein
MKVFEILIWIPKNQVFYNTKNLCHHVENILIYLWLKCEINSTIIVIIIDVFGQNYIGIDDFWIMF